MQFLLLKTFLSLFFRNCQQPKQYKTFFLSLQPYLKLENNNPEFNNFVIQNYLITCYLSNFHKLSPLKYKDLPLQSILNTTFQKLQKKRFKISIISSEENTQLDIEYGTSLMRKSHSTQQLAHILIFSKLYLLERNGKAEHQQISLKKFTTHNTL